MSEAEPSFRGLRIAALESRRRDDMHRMIERFGGVPFVSPSMRELPIDGNREAVDFAHRLITGEIGVTIFLTGVGFRHLLAVVERHVDRQRYLNALADTITIARGPKPVAAMKEVGLVPNYRAPEPNTWREVLQVIDQHVPLANQSVGIQEYGVTNYSLLAGLEARGARVVNVRVYQWELPEDCTLLQQNVQAVVHGERDAILLTSAHQIVNFIRMAQTMGLENEVREAFHRLCVASIGPTTSEMLQSLELPVDLEPEHPKMGHLVQTCAEHVHQILAAKRAKQSAHPIRLKSSTTSTANVTHGIESAPFLAACRRQATNVTPIWLMRQAGRYMAEYRRIRAKVGFLALCKNPELCAEVMVTAVERLGVDAAIIFSDLLPILEPMGMDLEFTKHDGPQIHNPLILATDVDRVRRLHSMDGLEFVSETVRLTKAALPDRIPVIGFAGAPFTLASYMIEGGSSRQYLSTKTFMREDVGAWKELMEKLVSSIAMYLNAQIDSGADCVQLFDSWVGCLGPEDYSRFVLPYMTELIALINPKVPVINFATGNPMLLTSLRGDDRTVVGLDWRTELRIGWDVVGADRAVQGNLDPTVLLADLPTIRREASRILKQAKDRHGHIFNLGHGILPQTPVEHVRALVDFVHESTAR